MIQDSLGFWNPHVGFRIPDTGFQYLSVDLGFWILIVSWVPDSLSCIPDYKTQNSGFHKKKFPGFRNEYFIIWCEERPLVSLGSTIKEGLLERFRILSIGHFRYQRETLFIHIRVAHSDALGTTIYWGPDKNYYYNYTKILLKINKLNQKLILKYEL